MPRRVVILGAGFGGLFAAIELEKYLPELPGAEVTLIDKNDYHMFLPLLYHVGTAGIEPGNICFPIRAIFKNGGSGPPMTFFECTVLGLDLPGKKIIADCAQIPYDYLIFALGSVTNYHQIPGLEEHTIPLKTITDGILMRNRILDAFEKALLEGDKDKRQSMLTFIIVGGGATGVELASAMSGFIFRTLPRDFPNLVPEAHVVMAEAGPSLLASMPGKVGEIATLRLKKQGAELIVNCSVKSCNEDGVQTRDGRFIKSRNVTWVGGVKPVALADLIPTEKSRDHRIIVDRNLAVPGVPGLYVVGDSASAIQPGTDRSYPPTAQTAVRMGKAAGRNIAYHLMGRPQVAFDYRYKGDLVFLGRNHAAGELNGRILSGFPAFFLYQAYHLRALMGFRNRMATFLDWMWDYFHHRNTSKLDYPIPPCPVPETPAPQEQPAARV